MPPGMEQLVGPEDIDWAASSPDAGNPPTLQLLLRPEATTRIADHTRENAGSYLAVAINGEVVSDLTSFTAFAPCVGK